MQVEEIVPTQPQLFFGEPYPNPSTGFVSLDIQSGEAMMVSVYDLLGREVERFELAPRTTKLTLSDYRPGHYFVRAQGGEEVVSQRFVVVQ
ncbi:MAG: T9SS type A sorting domain-containing protein [Bacteroidota bacterium]